MRLTDETLASLDTAASKQIGCEFGTTVGVMPGQLRELVRVYRQFEAINAADDAAVQLAASAILKEWNLHGPDALRIARLALAAAEVAKVSTAVDA